MKLQPIETAPHGQFILLFADSGYVTTPLKCEVCKYDANYRPRRPWVTYSGDAFEGEPRWWMPLPEIPMQTYTFYCTFGSGQPNFPGYLEVEVSAASYDDAIVECRRRMATATGGRWCGMYDSLDQMHPQDRVFRGKA